MDWPDAPLWLSNLVARGHLAHLALAVLGLEGLLVLVFRSRLGARALPLLVNVATGAVLMLIVRAALLGRPTFEILALFAVAFVLHLLDAMLRLRGR